MSLLNQANCVTSTGNTGIGDCYYTPGIIRGGFLAPMSFQLSAADLASETTLQAALQAAIIAPVGQRIYPLPPFVEITDNSADPITQTFGYGGITTVDDGDNNWTFAYTRGGLCVNNQLRKFNRSGYGFLFIDDTGLFATKNSTGDGMAPIPQENFYAFPWKANTRAAVTSFRLQFVFKPKYVNELVAFAPVSGFSLTDLQGVKNVALKVISRAAATPGVINLGIKLSCGGANLVDQYPDDIVTPGLVVVTNTATGNPVTISSEAIVELNNESELQLTLLTTDTDYNATLNGMTISFAPLATIDPLIGAYESNKVLTPVPA